jgi:hypothetical protein
MDAETRQQYRAEWRALGFFCDRDEAAKEWRFIGSRAGLLRFAELLNGLVSDPSSTSTSSFGPYVFFEARVSSRSEISSWYICGPRRALKRLAVMIEQRIADLEEGQATRIREEFAVKGDYALVLELRADGFDPASLDKNLIGEAG